MPSHKLICLSHTPLRGQFDPPDPVPQQAEQAIAVLGQALQSFDPELIVLFAPDHYNGFFYDLMPPFCLGAAARSIGDYGTLQGELNVPAGLARDCVTAVQAAGVDCAISYRMQVDHGFVQPLQWLTGSITRYPVLPIFINSLAPPMPSFRRARLLGQAVGDFIRQAGKRTVFIGSGGLSHNPPAPALEGASPEVAERLIAGRNPSAQQRAQREARTLAVAREFAVGGGGLHPLNPDWDRAFLQTLEARTLDAWDELPDAQVSEQAGASAHEVKNWVAANAAMAAATQGRYRVRADYYRPIPEWIAGFATLQGEPQ